MAKIMQASAMKACFLIAECSLSYAKVIKKKGNEQKSDDFLLISL